METSNDVTGPINLGNPGEFTMLKLAKLVLELTGSSSKIKFLPLPVDYPIGAGTLPQRNLLSIGS